MIAAITVNLFARFRDVIGHSNVELPVPLSIAELRIHMKQRWPELSTLLDSSRFAIDNDFVDDDRELQVGDELSLIPPVSGG